MNKILSCAAVVGLLVASSSIAFAKGPGGAPPSGGASSISPGQQFRSGGATGGYPGASGYSPGRTYVGSGGPTTGAPGASVYAPGFLK